MMKDYEEIFKIRAEGLCDACDYGFDNCIKLGKPYCKTENVTDNKKEVHNVQEESV